MRVYLGFQRFNLGFSCKEFIYIIGIYQILNPFGHPFKSLMKPSNLISVSYTHLDVYKRQACSLASGLIPASEEDWGKEYLDYIISVKIVGTIEEAIAHINRYNTGHSESIITSDYANAQKFLNEIDAAAVYVNASTRFTDGAEFGFGAEIGISTQKLHARGPMGLKELTTTKYVIYGNGQIRE